MISTTREKFELTYRRLMRIHKDMDKMSVPIEETSAGLVTVWSLTSGIRGGKITDLTPKLAIGRTHNEGSEASLRRMWIECAVAVYMDYLRKGNKTIARRNRDVLAAKVMMGRMFQGEANAVVAADLQLSRQTANNVVNRIVNDVMKVAEANGLL